MKLPRCTFLHLAAGAAALPPFAHRASAVLSYAAGAAHHRRLSWRRRGDVPIFATVNV